MSACIVQHGGHTLLNELLVKVDDEPLVGRLLTPRRPRLAGRRSIWTFGDAKTGKIRNRQNQKQKGQPLKYSKATKFSQQKQQ